MNARSELQLLSYRARLCHARDHMAYKYCLSIHLVTTIQVEYCLFFSTMYARGIYVDQDMGSKRNITLEKRQAIAAYCNK